MIQFMQVGAAFLYMFIVFEVSAVIGYIVHEISAIATTYQEQEINWDSVAFVVSLIANAILMYNYILK